MEHLWVVVLLVVSGGLLSAGVIGTIRSLTETDEWHNRQVGSILKHKFK